MNLSAPFIHRPIATTLLAIGIALSGILAFNLLPVASLPQVEFPTIQVQASLPGASPEIMASSVATPLERQFSRIAGITDMTSSSSLGSSGITLQFDLSRNIDGAARDVQAAINAASSDLPVNLPTHPTYRKVNPADPPIMILGLTSDTYTVQDMYDKASTILQQKILKLNGVGLVNVGGSSLPAVRIELNPLQLNQYGLALSDVADFIAKANVNEARGQLSDDKITFDIVTNDQLTTASDYRSLIISYQNGRPVRLEDVAEVKNSVQNLRNAGQLNGKPSVALIIYKEPGANVIKTIDNIRATMPELADLIPSGMNMDVVLDRTVTIKASLHDIEISLIASLVLVILVVYIFLGNFRAMLIPSTAMCVSLLGTFGIMYLLGFSLNNLSLMAITIATGFVIDDAIVVLENISRHIEEGLKPKQAALKGAEEIGFTVTSISISLIAVFIPILCMGGIIGRLFREFALTLSIAILISLVASLSLTPMMCAYLLRSKSSSQEKVSKLRQITIDMKHFYARTLKISLGHSRMMISITIGTLILSICLFIIVPKGFFPQQDTGRIISSIVADQDISFQSLKVKFIQFMEIVKKDPDVANAIGFIGGSNVNSGTVFITLTDRSKRDANSDQVINRLRPQLAVIPGATLYMQSAQDIVVGGRLGNAQFQYTISADDLATINNTAPDIMQRLGKVKGITDVNSDQRNHGLESFVNINYDLAAKYGVSVAEIDKTLYSAFGQRLASTMYKDMNQYYVVLEVAPQFWQDPSILNSIYVKSNTGKLVPLSSFSDFEANSTLLSVNHQGLSPSATISFNLAPEVPLGNAVSLVKSVVEEMHLPKTIFASFRGSAQAFQDSLSSQHYLILTALLAVYIVLGMLYESLIHPVTILSTLPSAGVGALLALLITKIDLTIIALIGIILLIGLVKKNAIMMVDFVIQIERGKNIQPKEAIYEAALLRFRPIMMTTMAAMLGATPLAFGFGTGSELRQPLGVAIIGGLMVSQVLTLYCTPVVYLYMDKARIAWSNFRFKRNIEVLNAK